MSENIDLSKIPVFLTVAKHGSFTEAAYELFLSQSGVSKTIAALEDSLGFALFTRESRKITLTPEGVCLYNRFSKVMQDVDQAVLDARNIHSGDFGSVSIGTSGYLPKTPVFEQICSGFCLDHAAFEIDMQYLPYPALRKKLLDDSLDMILYNTHDLAMLHGLHYLTMMKGECLLCYNRLIPSQGSGDQTIFDFKDRPFVCLDPDLIPGYYAYLRDTCRAFGFSPNIVKYTQSLQELIHYINISSYVSILDKTLFPIEDADVGSITIGQTPGMPQPMETVLAWKAGRTSPALETFIAFAVHFTKKEIQEI